MQRPQRGQLERSYKMFARYEAALEKIGTERLLRLPQEVKNVLMNCYDLEIKTQMLELIVSQLGL